MATSKRWAYFFGNGKADGRGDQTELLGGKGAGLAEMTRIGLPVPAGFTITTEACKAFNQRSGRWPSGLEKQVRRMLAKLERACGKTLGGGKDPLLVSVRSGAARSMPGMMETILNLGLNDRSVEALARASSNRRFALDSYRRLITMYGATTRGISKDVFEDALDHVKQTRTRARLGCGPDRVIVDTDVSEDELAVLVDDLKAIYRQHTGEDFPQDPFQQLQGAIDAVFRSWMAEKAVTYRRVENITGLDGTAVNVCQMVFGNIGDDCATGVCFTRDPSTGEAVLYGDALINAQGEDVVAGIRTPLRLAELQSRMPQAYDQLEAVRAMLEVHYKDMQDLEFTIEHEKLFMLQCRVGKRSPTAAFKIAVDQATKGLISAATARRLVQEGFLPKRFASAAARPIISRDEAIRRINAVDIQRLFFPVIAPHLPAEELTRRRLGAGIGAVPGAACGEVVFSADEAEVRAGSGRDVILVRKETSPEDVGGMHVAKGILTATGGKTSHAAVVARGWGKCCVVGCGALRINYRDRTMTIGGRTVREGKCITLEGTSGAIYEGSIELARPEPPPEFQTLLKWCDARRRMGVRANADTPADAQKAVELGAEGIGLCRTEHMFFDASQPRRLTAMRRMILADNADDRRRALEELLPFQRGDFEGIFTAMAGKPVTVRLLDPPLHEFLPRPDNVDAMQDIVDEMNAAPGRSARRVTLEDLKGRVEQLHESNPMLGHRGCRLCITFPEILEFQVRAIMEAAVACAQRGVKVLPEIMIPLTIDPRELARLVAQARGVADSAVKGQRKKISYLVGTMIETPRAAILAGPMAESAEFFSFGTNDLTQMAMGLSRDDAGRFLPEYIATPPSDGTTPGKAILPHDPFQSLDVCGVGRLMAMAVTEGRAARPRLKLGVCGEHGGDEHSILFCEQLGLDYVSCSPFRVPVARLAAAKAAILAPQSFPRILKINAKPRAIVEFAPPASGRATAHKKTSRKRARRKKGAKSRS